MSLLVSCLYHFFKFNLAINNFLNHNLWFRLKQINDKIYSNRIIKVAEYDLNLVQRKIRYQSYFIIDLFNYLVFNEKAGLVNFNFHRDNIYEISYADRVKIICRGKDIGLHLSENTHRNFSNNTYIYVGLNIGFHKKEITQFVNKQLKRLSNIKIMDLIKILRLSNVIDEYDYNTILESPNEPCITCVTCDQDLIITIFKKEEYMI